jgi:hypothetical protein
VDHHPLRPPGELLPVVPPRYRGIVACAAGAGLRWGRRQVFVPMLMGHGGTSFTERMHRKQIRPVVEDGATAIDRIFPRASG